MELSIEQDDACQIVRVETDRIDAAAAIQFKEAMRRLTAEAPPRVVLDLGRVDFIDSSGLGAIVATMKQLGAERRLDLAALQPNVQKVFHLTRMDTVFRIFASPAEACRAEAG